MRDMRSAWLACPQMPDSDSAMLSEKVKCTFCFKISSNTIRNPLIFFLILQGEGAGLIISRLFGNPLKSRANKEGRKKGRKRKNFFYINENQHLKLYVVFIEFVLL